MQHQAGKGHEMQTRQDLWQPLIVTGQAAEAGGPSKVSLDDPALGQENKAVLGLRQLDDLEADAMGLGSVSRVLARVALVDVGQLHRVPGHLLYRRRQRIHPYPPAPGLGHRQA